MPLTVAHIGVPRGVGHTLCAPGTPMRAASLQARLATPSCPTRLHASAQHQCVHRSLCEPHAAARTHSTPLGHIGIHCAPCAYQCVRSYRWCDGHAHGCDVYQSPTHACTCTMGVHGRHHRAHGGMPHDGQQNAPGLHMHAAVLGYENRGVRVDRRPLP